MIKLHTPESLALFDRCKQLEKERDEARAAYAAETLSTAELMADNARLERIVKDLNDANRVLFESQRESDGMADAKSDGQAENDQVEARRK